MSNMKRNVYKNKIKQNKYFSYIEEFIITAIDAYPVIKALLFKIDVFKSDQEGASALSYSIWKSHPFLSLECRYEIYLDTDFINQDSLDVNDIKGLLWHEIGHILSVYVYINQKHFRINKHGRIVVNSLGINQIKKAGNELTYRLKIIDLFWNKMRKKYITQKFDEFEHCLSLHLSTQNSSELLAECYKYAYAGKEHYGEDEFFSQIIQMAENVVTDFCMEYLS